VLDRVLPRIPEYQNRLNVSSCDDKCWVQLSLVATGTFQARPGARSKVNSNCEETASRVQTGEHYSSAVEWGRLGLSSAMRSERVIRRGVEWEDSQLSWGEIGVGFYQQSALHTVLYVSYEYSRTTISVQPILL